MAAIALYVEGQRGLEFEHPVAVHFKGSGFYATDYGSRKTKSKDADAPPASEKSADKSAEKSSTDSKPKPAADSSS